MSVIHQQYLSKTHLIEMKNQVQFADILKAAIEGFNKYLNEIEDPEFGVGTIDDETRHFERSCGWRGIGQVRRKIDVERVEIRKSIDGRRKVQGRKKKKKDRKLASADPILLLLYT